MKAYEKQMHEVNARVRAIPEYKAVADKIEAANQSRGSAQKRVNSLPQLSELSARMEKESDGQKKKELREQHNRLCQQLLANDLQYQQAVVTSSRLSRKLNNMLRYKVRAERRKLESGFNALRKSRDKLRTTLTAANQGHAALQKEIAAKSKLLADIRSTIQQRTESKDVYKNVEQKRHDARK